MAYARTVVPGPNGQPVYVEFDPETGEEVDEIAESIEHWAGLNVFSSDEYGAWLTRLQGLRNTRPDYELVSREDYQAATYTTVSGQPMVKEALAPQTLYVALLPEPLRYMPDTDIVLLELPIDPDESLHEDTRSLILDPETGEIRHQSPYNIGYRVGFFGNEDDPIKAKGNFWREYGDTVYGPIRSADVEVGGPFRVRGRTGVDGSFHLRYMIPACPGFMIRYDTDLFLELYYQRFNPRSSNRRRPYVVRNRGSDVCNGKGYAFRGSGSIRRDDFLVDLMILSGSASIENDAGTIEVVDADDGSTTYDHNQSALSRVAQQEYDLDGDGKSDITRLGREEFVEGEVQFISMTADQNPPLQGVWFSSLQVGGELGTDVRPDVTRLVDWSADFEDRGLLSQITEDDLEDTDLYIFRESDGSLIAERKGLDPNELFADYGVVGTQPSATGTEDPNVSPRFHYTVHLLADTFNRFAPGSNYYTGFDFAEWQAAGGFDERFQQQQADHLRPGEKARLIAINRASGYMGSLVTKLQAAGGRGGDHAGEISFHIDELVLLPPNLRIWAERQYEVEDGLSRGEEREYLIGNEGAAEADDTAVTIYSSWYDHDGRPLPEELADYGYTARLAYVAAENTLREAPVAPGSVAHFPIKPGNRVQVIRLPWYSLNNWHLYVQVSGQPHTRNPDFGKRSGDRANAESFGNALTHRPERFVPVLVPVFDENRTEYQQKIYNHLRRAYEEGAIDQYPRFPEPVYWWLYRPEYQYSVYDLRVEALTREDLAGNAEDILQLSAPVVSSSDTMLEMLYSLRAPEHRPLKPYSYRDERQLVLSFGEQEVQALIGDRETARFPNMEHLATLDPDDLQALRLYSNNDVANVLWEWAFMPLLMVPDMNRDGRITFDTGNGGKGVVAASPSRPASRRRKPTSNDGDSESDDVDGVGLGQAAVALMLSDEEAAKQDPFHFWVNDDDDETEIMDGDGDVPDAGKPDHETNYVDGIRDLVDFFPVYLDLQGVLSAYPASDHTYSLVHADEALAFIETRLLADSEFPEFGPSAPLKDADIARELVEQEVKEIGASGSDDGSFSQDFLQRMLHGRGGVILVEASKPTTQPLVLEVRSSQDSKLVASKELKLSISAVEEMYRHLNLQDIPEQRGWEPGSQGVSTTEGEPSGLLDRFTESKYFVFVHGWNVSGKEARGWNSEMFKRMYQLGFTGRFIGVTWHGDLMDIASMRLHYYHAVYNAFAASEKLEEQVRKQIGDYGPVMVAAHSLGNMLVSNAIAEHGFSASRYFMFNAAVPTEAFESAQQSIDMKELDWWGYPEEVTASGWHSLFPEEDPRAKLKWGDRFAGIVPILSNFYSPGEEVLENADRSTISEHLVQYVESGGIDGFMRGQRTWAIQELAKGCKHSAVKAGEIFGNCSGGWKFNWNQDDLEFVGREGRPLGNLPPHLVLHPYDRWLYYLLLEFNPERFAYVAVEALEEKPVAIQNKLKTDRMSGVLSNEALAQFGMFERFSHPVLGEQFYRRIYAPIMSDDSRLSEDVGRVADAQNFADQKEVVWGLLSSAIPAVSYAAGSNPIRVLGSRNYNMQAMRNGWTGQARGDWGDRWLHSDIKNMALPYVSPIFEKLLELQ